LKATSQLNCRRKRVPTTRSSILDPRSCIVAAVLLAIALGGCGTAARRDGGAPPPRTGGGYYLDDGPGANPPADLASIPDAEPRVEPLHRGTMRPYVVMGRSYTPMTRLEPYRARGVATWYGRRYHGKQTSSGEIYDMYKMTAAHPVLPIPSYVRVTNLANGRSVAVRVNDRGPFVDDRLIDLSYTAAHKLGIVASGTGRVEVELILPGESGGMVAAAPPAPDPDPPPRVAAREPEPVAVPPVAAAPPSAPVADAPAIPVAAEASGYFLQLGAFGSRANAEDFLARMKAGADWLANTLHIYARDGLFRVHAGPYSSQPEARGVADRLREALGVKPFVLTR